ncbi:hypothetical protein U1Q18_049597 [Sarracenia purpurea var. burkii]
MAETEQKVENQISKSPDSNTPLKRENRQNEIPRTKLPIMKRILPKRTIKVCVVRVNKSASSTPPSPAKESAVSSPCSCFSKETNSPISPPMSSPCKPLQSVPSNESSFSSVHSTDGSRKSIDSIEPNLRTPSPLSKSKFVSRLKSYLSSVTFKKTITFSIRKVDGQMTAQDLTHLRYCKYYQRFPISGAVRNATSRYLYPKFVELKMRRRRKFAIPDEGTYYLRWFKDLCLSEVNLCSDC